MRRTAAALLCLMALPAAAQPIAWRHGIVAPKSDAGIVLMPGEGFDAQHGLKLDYVPLQGDPIGFRALLNGEVETYEATAAGAVVAPGRGADVKIIGCHLPGLPHGFFVRAGIDSLAAIKGKTIAISQPGALPDALARALLEKSGIKPTEVQFANLGTDIDRFKALVAGKVDVAVVSGEYQPIAAQQGVKMLIAGREVLPDYMRQCIVTTSKLISARRDALVRFVAAEIAGLRHAVAHRDQALALTSRITEAKPDDPRAAYIFDDMVKNHAVDPELSIPLDKLAWMEDQALKLGDLKAPIDLKTIIDPTIRQDALALLGK